MRLLIICYIAFIATLASAKETLPESDPQENFQISDYFEIKKNDYQSNEVEGRSQDSLEDKVESFIKSHDVTFKLPIIGSTLTIAGRNLDNSEVDVKLNFNDGRQIEARKKSKLKKIFVPIFVFILIKAMVMIPLALGILAIKTWNALQLSFVSFVVALALGVWQLCKKISGDNVHPHIVAAHSPWDDPHHVAARAFSEEAHKMAYSAYASNL